jgi:hypothetical protein
MLERGRGGGLGRLDLKRTTEYMAKQYLFQFFIVSTSNGARRFVPMVLVVDRGNATGQLDLFQILMSCSQFHYTDLCHLDENDEHMWILSRIVENHYKIK